MASLSRNGSLSFTAAHFAAGWPAPCIPLHVAAQSEDQCADPASASYWNGHCEREANHAGCHFWRLLGQAAKSDGTDGVGGKSQVDLNFLLVNHF